MRLNDKFLGCRKRWHSFFMPGCDSEEQFLENCKTQPDDWYYKDIKIEYSYNEYGHRCNSLKDINLDNYILFTGCSHTEGSGLELERSYPYLVSKKLQTDYYNLAVSGSGLDVLEYNLLVWFSFIPKKPKAVVIQWPVHSRFLSLRPGYKHFIEEGSWGEDKDILKFIAASEESKFFLARKKIVNDLLYQIIDVPIFNVQYSHLDLSNSKEYVPLVREDLARDLSHAGIKSHQNTANQLIEQIYLRR